MVIEGVARKVRRGGCPDSTHILCKTLHVSILKDLRIQAVVQKQVGPEIALTYVCQSLKAHRAGVVAIFEERIRR